MIDCVWVTVIRDFRDHGPGMRTLMTTYQNSMLGGYYALQSGYNNDNSREATSFKQVFIDVALLGTPYWFDNTPYTPQTEGWRWFCTHCTHTSLDQQLRYEYYMEAFHPVCLNCNRESEKVECPLCRKDYPIGSEHWQGLHKVFSEKHRPPVVYDMRSKFAQDVRCSDCGFVTRGKRSRCTQCGREDARSSNSNEQLARHILDNLSPARNVRQRTDASPRSSYSSSSSTSSSVGSNSRSNSTSSAQQLAEFAELYYSAAPNNVVNTPSHSMPRSSPGVANHHRQQQVLEEDSPLVASTGQPRGSPIGTPVHVHYHNHSVSNAYQQTAVFQSVSSYGTPLMGTPTTNAATAAATRVLVDQSPSFSHGRSPRHPGLPPQTPNRRPSYSSRPFQSPPSRSVVRTIAESSPPPVMWLSPQAPSPGLGPSTASSSSPSQALSTALQHMRFEEYRHPRKQLQPPTQSPLRSQSSSSSSPSFVCVCNTERLYRDFEHLCSHIADCSLSRRRTTDRNFQRLVANPHQVAVNAVIGEFHPGNPVALWPVEVNIPAFLCGCGDVFSGRDSDVRSFSLHSKTCRFISKHETGVTKHRFEEEDNDDRGGADFGGGGSSVAGCV